MREVKLNQLHAVIGELDYPISKANARDELSDVTLLFADGEEPLPDVVSRSNVERYGTVDDLETEIFNHLPVRAVGEPGQSEGDA
jgi:hypothetical protein